METKSKLIKKENTEAAMVWAHHPYRFSNPVGQSTSLDSRTGSVFPTIVLQLQQQRDSDLEYMSLSLYDLNNPEYMLSSPISVVVSRDSQGYYVESADFDVYGVGGDVRGAVEDFKDTLIGYYEDLLSDESVLSEFLVGKMKVLKDLIFKHG